MNEKIESKAVEITNILKAMSHEGRLQILCHLTSGEKSVADLQTTLTCRQSSVSQQLSRLRLEGLVSPRRDGKSIYYRLSDDRVPSILAAIQDVIGGAEIKT